MMKYLGLHCHDLYNLLFFFFYNLLLDGLAKIVHTYTDAGEVKQIWQEVSNWWKQMFIVLVMQFFCRFGNFQNKKLWIFINI